MLLSFMICGWNLAKGTLLQLKDVYFLWAAQCQRRLKSLERLQLSCAPPQCGERTHSSGSLDKRVGFYCHYCNLQTFLKGLLRYTHWCYVHWHGHNFSLWCVALMEKHWFVAVWQVVIIYAFTNMHAKYCVVYTRAHMINKGKHTHIWHRDR